MSISLCCGWFATVLCCGGGVSKENHLQDSKEAELKRRPPSQKQHPDQIKKLQSEPNHLEEQSSSTTVSPPPPPPPPQSPLHLSERTSIAASSSSCDSSHDHQEIPLPASPPHVGPVGTSNVAPTSLASFSDIMLDLDEYLAETRRSDTTLFPLCMTEPDQQQELAAPQHEDDEIESKRDDQSSFSSSSSSSSSFSLPSPSETAFSAGSSASSESTRLREMLQEDVLAIH